jgi:hypothetical protein
VLRLRNGVRVGAIGVVGVLACTMLTACGSDDKSADKNGKATSSPGAREEGTAAVRTAFDKTAEADTARLTLRTETSAEGKTLTADGKGVIDLGDGHSVMTVVAGGQKVEQRVVDQVLYQKVPEKQRAQVPGKKPWIKIDLKKAAAQQGGGNDNQVSDPAESAAFAKGVTDKDVKKVGTATIDGVKTTQYGVTVDVDKLSNGAKLKQQVGPTLPMDLWLDDEGRIRQQRVDMIIRAPKGQASNRSAAQRVKVRTLVGFSGFGTEVETDAPPAGQVADMTGRAMGQQGKQ